MARGFSYAPGASDEVELAQQEELSRAQVQALAGGRNAVVREVIAGRADLPLGTMVGLAHDKVAEVRVAVAGNPASTSSILDHLSHDRHAAVLHALLDNPAVERSVIESLAFHRKEEVRTHAVRRLDDATTASSARAGDIPPELRDKVRLADVMTLPVAQVSLHGETTYRPTRTAPVRGFRPAQDA
ncbi:hypothetical protein [Demequina sp.]|uniref:hypothetical protein n=1 Tax=Demequina sp. TaxID=2050685 RepID=UPI003A8358BB